MLTAYNKTIFFSFLFFLLFTLLSFGNSADSKSSTEVNEPQFIQNEKSNNGIFNPVEYYSFKGYQGDGSFVEAPAMVGDWTGYIIGVLPAELITEPIRLLSICGYEGDDIGTYILYGTTKAFGCLFGGPSFIFKGIFYDAPIWVYSSIFGIQSSSKTPVEYKAEPVLEPVAIDKVEKEPATPDYKWQPEERQYPKIYSISAKPSMLEEKETSAETEIAFQKQVQDQTQVTIEQPENEAKPETVSEFLPTPALTPVKDEITKEDETSWSSPPPLPDWVKEEMDKKQ